MTLLAYLDEYYLAFRPSTSPRTIRLYHNTIRKFGQFVGRSPTLEDLNNQTVGQYLISLLKIHKPATVAKERAQLLAIWRDARNEGLVDRGPRVQPIRVADPMPRALSVEELRQLWLAFDSLQGLTGGNENSDVLRAAATLTLTTSERIEAVSKLLWSDIDGRVIQFRADNRKGGRRSEVREVPSHAIDYLDCLHRRSQYVFPGCQGTTKLNILYRRAFDRSGIETHGKTSTLLRSSYGTYIDLAGENASKAMGHQGEAVTQKHYLDKTYRPKDYYRHLPFMG